jgi:hypothetical protein
MRIPASLLAALTTLVLAGTACGGDSDEVALDPATGAPSPSEPSTPVPNGPVTTRDLATVMDTGVPELCLGPIAESYPPQCGGPRLTGWDWETLGQGMFEQEGDVRWGTYLVTGTWDGTSMSPSDAIPGALYDRAMPSETPTPAADKPLTDQQLEAIAEELRDLVPGYLGAHGADGHVVADVYYDDGSLQEWADSTFGPHVVVITSALVDAG